MKFKLCFSASQLKVRNCRLLLLSGEFFEKVSSRVCPIFFGCRLFISCILVMCLGCPRDFSDHFLELYFFGRGVNLIYMALSIFLASFMILRDFALRLNW